jgi:hypothetical protein
MRFDQAGENDHLAPIENRRAGSLDRFADGDDLAVPDVNIAARDVAKSRIHGHDIGVAQDQLAAGGQRRRVSASGEGHSSDGRQASQESTAVDGVAHGRDYTTSMNLKSAAFLALVGMILLTVLLIADFINVLLGVMRDIVPMVMLLRSLIYMLASLAVTVFFWVFYRGER